MPKIELHAHLSGSIAQTKLAELLERRGLGGTFAPFNWREDLRSPDFLAKAWGYFGSVAEVVTDLEALRECALHVFDSFAAEACLYLELRTTPKQFKIAAASQVEGGEPAYTTMSQYLETVEGAIEEFQSYSKKIFGFVMEIKLLLSVDRGRVNSREEALAQIDGVLDMSRKYPGLVVGIDVCGNPSKASVVPHLIPALLERKDAFANLPITFHTGETVNDEECELIMSSMAALNIRRLGHVCFFPDACRRRVLAGGVHGDGGAVGIELCPTSNLVLRELSRMEEHHFLDWWQKSDKVLLSINTDDVGLFSCTLSSEVHGLATAFGLTRQDLVEIQRQALRASFHPDKQRLIESFEAALEAWRSVPLRAPEGPAAAEAPPSAVLASDAADAAPAKRRRC